MLLFATAPVSIRTWAGLSFPSACLLCALDRIGPSPPSPLQQKVSLSPLCHPQTRPHRCYRGFDPTAAGQLGYPVATMPPLPFHQLSDEPLYCEAVHNKDDDGFYSGSEDDHYEGPLHRRLHIEKKAIDFLSGNVPILLSAALRGPFDRKQWNNPWRSARAESSAEPSKPRPSRSRQKAAPEDDLPDTQGTSLYPLPSPEITNPPSARKNPYMDEQDYSRIKNWRAAVKSTSASRDPFWQSQQDKDDNHPARKRSADPTWLHKRDRKKRRSANPRDSTPDDSPSRSAARAKDTQTRQLHAAQAVAQFLRDSSPPEDELATTGRARSPCSNTPPMANKSAGLPDHLRSGRTTPHRRTRLRQAADTSEDELSLPAATPTSYAVRSSTMASKSPTKDRSPAQRGKTTKRKSRPRRGRGNAPIGREKEKAQRLSQSSTSQVSGHDGVRVKPQTVAQTAQAALECMDGSPQTLFTEQSERLQDQLLPDSAATAKPMVASRALAAMPSTQQDNSFLFHKKAISPAGKIERAQSTGVPMDAATLSPSSLLLYVTKANEQGNHFTPSDGLAVPVVPSPTTAMTKDSDKGHEVPSELMNQSRDPIFSPAANEGLSSHSTTNIESPRADGNKANDDIKLENEFPATVGTEAARDSPVVEQRRSANKHEALEEPRTFLQVDGCSHSDSEWSTYLDTQNQSAAFPSEEESTKKSDDTPVVEYGVSDPEWSTFVNTQDITPLIPRPEAPEDPVEMVTDAAYRCPDIQVGSNQTTHANVESLRSISPDQAIMAQESLRAASHGVLSPDLAGQAGDASEDSCPARSPQDAKYSQISVGSIIDAYADMSVLSMKFGTSMMEMPRAVHGETEAEVINSTCSSPNQIATVPVDESVVHNESVPSGRPPQLQTTIQKQVVTEFQLGSSYDPSIPDEIMSRVETRIIDDSSGLSLQTPRESEETAGCGGCLDGSSFLNEPVADSETPQLQSPWAGEAAHSVQMPPQAPSNASTPGSESGSPEEAAARVQSPWNKKTDTASHLFTPLTTCTGSTGSTKNLSLLAGKALAMSQQPQSPWGPQTPAAPNLPAPDFEVSIRAFSDFMSPSPVKKRAPSNRSSLRGSSARSGTLYKTPGQRRPDRRVHFAPLPGEQETCITETDSDGKDAIYDEEDVSYFDLSGRKTGTVRMPKPTMRAASPPPTEMSPVDVGALPDHDQKFAKHFEAMSKRKKPSRKSLRLLPSESQQTAPASQEVGAMAEAFIQASQTRKRGLELAAEKGPDAECRYAYEKKISVPAAMDSFEDQENVEPVDDVSAVLDNLDEFLDNTWGIEMGTDDCPTSNARSKQEKETAPSQAAPRKAEDPLLSLEANIWAE